MATNTKTIQSKINVEIVNIKDELKDKHNDYIRALKKAMASIEREITAHKTVEHVSMPSTTMEGDLMCGSLDYAQRISNGMTTLAGKLSLLEYLARG